MNGKMVQIDGKLLTDELLSHMLLSTSDYYNVHIREYFDIKHVCYVFIALCKQIPPLQFLVLFVNVFKIC